MVINTDGVRHQKLQNQVKKEARIKKRFCIHHNDDVKIPRRANKRIFQMCIAENMQRHEKLYISVQ